MYASSLPFLPSSSSPPPFPSYTPHHKNPYFSKKICLYRYVFMSKVKASSRIRLWQELSSPPPSPPTHTKRAYFPLSTSTLHSTLLHQAPGGATNTCHSLWYKQGREGRGLILPCQSSSSLAEGEKSACNLPQPTFFPRTYLASLRRPWENRRDATLTTLPSNQLGIPHPNYM